MDFDDYIDATIGFESVSELMHKHQSLIGSGGNPQAHNPLDVVSQRQRAERVKIGWVYSPMETDAKC
jgi:hypothetical protein